MELIYAPLLSNLLVAIKIGILLHERITGESWLLIFKRKPKFTSLKFFSLDILITSLSLILMTVNNLSIGKKSGSEGDDNQNSSKSNIKKSISDKIQKQWCWQRILVLKTL